MSDHAKLCRIRGREVRESECRDCLQRQDCWRLVVERFERAAFPARLVEWAKAERAGKQQPESAGWREYWQRVKADLCGRGVTLAFIGGRGTGKTQLATVAGLHVCGQGRDARYWRAAFMFARFKSSYQPGAKESERAVFNDLTHWRLLVVDEIGECNKSEWEGHTLANIVCQRHDDGLDTILIGNLTAEAFFRVVGDSITDRMAEGGSVFVFNWRSFRGAPKT